MHGNDLVICKIMLNADLFRQGYPKYPLVNLDVPRGAFGIPNEYGETAERLCEVFSDSFRNAITQRTNRLAELRHPVEETISLQTGERISVNYAEVYAMVQTSKALSNDELQTEISTGLMRLASEQVSASIFLSLAKSIYVFWNCPALQEGIHQKDLEAIDMIQRYMNGALWAAEVHGDLRKI